MTSANPLHVLTSALLETLHLQGRELSPPLKTAFERLSPEHPSGILLAQLETPMMKQFREAKDEVPDALLFFRMGDFFELFGADAIIASEICGLTLTSRDRNSDNPVPMAGAPAVAHRAAIKKCVEAGFKVAVCDQVEDPRQAKGIVRREIVRVATPALPGDWDDESDASTGCYLAALHGGKKGWTLAFIDISTADFRITADLDEELLRQELLTIAPKEVLVASDKVMQTQQFLRDLCSKPPRVTALEPWIFRSERNCLDLFKEFFPEKALHQFGISYLENGLQVTAGILSYLKATQRSVLQNVKNIAPYELKKHLMIDEATKRHLDFFQTSTGERKGSLFWFLNKCMTGQGARLLARRINYPFCKTDEIGQSLDAVEALYSNPGLEAELHAHLRTCSDTDRLVARTAQGTIDAKGLVWLRSTLRALLNFQALLAKNSEVARSFQNILESLESVESLQTLTAFLATALEEEPAWPMGKGGKTFCTGFSAELDELAALEQNFDAMMLELERKERERSQIQTLKIGYTRVFGYYFEVSKGKLAHVPAHFLRKQTLSTGERFITEELKELEEKALTASEKKAALERDLFEGVRNRVLEFVELLGKASDIIARLDLFRCFAGLAKDHGWCKPKLTDANVTALHESVHPILQALQTGGEPFVPNTILVGETKSLDSTFPVLRNSTSDAKILLITGPNMAGKSTVMRQVALTQLLCQMGSFVPAKAAVVGVCDRIFTRIGSSDNALKSQSTFMVEMLESAQMLRYATEKSLLLMDEIGRGTSTFDGLSIAWAILEDLHDRVNARTLFSTHYHELLEVAEGRSGIAPMQMEVLERDIPSTEGTTRREILFSRRFLSGAAGKSYGIHVAELAGHSPSLVSRADQILQKLTASKHETSLEIESNVAIETTSPTEIERAEDEPCAWKIAMSLLQEKELNNTTPFEALKFLFDIQEVLKDDHFNLSKEKLNEILSRDSTTRRKSTKRWEDKRVEKTLFEM
jgi:DNA mismatch repair protein MutS